MLVDVLLFAAAKVRAGSPTTVVELAEPATVADLKSALVRSCPALAPMMDSVRVAVNSTYAEDDDPIPPGAEVAVIPPVSGGAGIESASVRPDRIRISITSDAIDHAAVTDSVRSDQAGAVCSFLGTVREMTGDRRTVALEYEAYPSMAEKTLADLAVEAHSRWPIERLAIVHRVGKLDLGEVSVVVAVSCPHRDQAFDACRWLIDTLKLVVPIWKKEAWADGTEEWVHPGGGGG